MTQTKLHKSTLRPARADPTPASESPQPGIAPAQSAQSSGCGTFLNEGEYWAIGYEGMVVRLPDAKGLRYLALLLATPHVPRTAMELLGRCTDPHAASAAVTERARSAVTKRIKEAIRRIATHHPALGYHLSTAVRTGTRCAYEPDPSRRFDWHLEAADRGCTRT